jgi:DNA-binding XRE family transcriptional regulator
MDTQSVRLKFARERKGLGSAAEAARELGVGVSTYRHHENGTRKLKWAAASRYARFFDVEPLWLFSGEGPMSASGIDREVVRIARAMTPDERAAWFLVGRSVVGKNDRPR